jgi:hypothetical protein
LGVADLKYDFLIVWRAPRATQSKNHIWIKQRRFARAAGGIYFLGGKPDCAYLLSSPESLVRREYGASAPSQG